jgi:hypothetical protein
MDPVNPIMSIFSGVVRWLGERNNDRDGRCHGILK